MMVKILLFVAFLFLSLSCQTPVKPPSEPLPSPVPWKLSWEKHSENKPWSDYTAKLISEHLEAFDKATDSSEFCPLYRTLPSSSRVQVWSELVSAISKFESNWNPRSTYQEPPPPRGPGTLSVGLLQMSVGDPYPNCFNKGDDPEILKDPLNNLKCGVSAMAKLIAKDGVIARSGPHRGLARYWAVIREPDASRAHHKKDIQDMVKRVLGCQ